MGSGPFPWRIAGWPVALGLAVRLLYWAVVTPHWTSTSDADQYLRIARNLANGDGFSLVYPQLSLHHTAFRPPLYPLLLAIPTAVFGNHVLWPARLLSILIALGVIALTVVFVRRVSSDLAGLCAGLCVAVYPPLIANDTITLTEPLGLLLLLALLIALDARKPAWCGLAVGLLLLTRPNAYLVVVIAAIVLWRYVGLKKVLLFIAVCGLVVAPWLARNQVQVGAFRLTTSEGFNLAAIYSPQAQENGGFVDPVLSELFTDRDLRLSQLFGESEWNSRLTRVGVDGIRNNPGYVATVARKNFLRYFELTPSRNDSPETLDGRNATFRRWTLPLFYSVTIVGFIGLWLSRRNAALWPAMAIVAQFALLSFLLVAPPRLRSPFDLLMCIGVGLSADRIARRFKQTRSGRSRPERGAVA